MCLRGRNSDRTSNSYWQLCRVAAAAAAERDDGAIPKRFRFIPAHAECQSHAINLLVLFLSLCALRCVMSAYVMRFTCERVCSWCANTRTHMMVAPVAVTARQADARAAHVYDMDTRERPEIATHYKQQQ